MVGSTVRALLATTAVLAWAGCGLVGEGMFNATERVRFARLYQDPLSSRRGGAEWAALALGGPVALAGSTLFVLGTAERGYQGVNFNDAPKPCVEVSEAERELWCGTNR